MKVLFLSKYAVSPKFGDPTRQFFYSKYLAKQHDTFVQLISSRSAACPHLLPFKGLKTEADYDRLNHVVLNGPKIDLGFNLKRVGSWIWFEIQILRNFRSIKAWKPDVIIVSSLSILTFLTGIVLKRLLRVPLVIEVRDVYPETLVSLGKFSRYNPLVILLGWIEKAGYRCADAITSSLPNLQHHINRRLGYQKNVTYLPMGYDPEFFSDSRPLSEAGESVLRLVESIPDVFWVGYFGTIGTANALEHTLEAFKQLNSCKSNVHLLVVGDGPLRSKYQAEYSAVDNMHFVGRVPKTDLPYLIQPMSIVINPWLDRSIYQFGISPNKWIDYMAAAKPIFACYGGYRFVLEDVGCGWFVEPENTQICAESILNIAEIPTAELEQMGNKGRDFLMKNWTFDKLAEKLRTVLERVIADRSHVCSEK
jgi:glycosyltransferase involved in cell wall biosynthesis